MKSRFQHDNSFYDALTENIKLNITIANSICVGGDCGVMVIVVGDGHSDTSSNPGRVWLHFT